MPEEDSYYYYQHVQQQQGAGAASGMNQEEEEDKRISLSPSNNDRDAEHVSRDHDDDDDNAGGAGAGEGGGGSRRRESIWELFVRGGGMFCESYFLFSVGNIKGIFEKAYPHCWGDHSEHSTCPESLRASITYTEIVGVIFGMLVVGALGDKLGRRWGSRLVSGIMLTGAFMLCASEGPTVQGQFIMFTVALGFFGIGVGGEYPMASSSAAETSETKTRGQSVVLVFSMQGLGILINSLVITLLLLIFGQTGAGNSLDATKLEAVWRLQYGFGIVFLLCLVWYRFRILKETTAWQREVEAAELDDTSSTNSETHSLVKQDNEHPDVIHRHTSTWVHNMSLLFQHFWHRVIGSGGGWLVWDVTFYGNKLFQGKFINVIEEEHTVFTTLKWTLVNAIIAYVGYFVAAFTIDRKWMGRRKMQVMGFTIVTLIFLICGFAYHTLRTPAYIHVFQLLYYASSFFGQWGPNATTFLLPSEIFPTQLRGTAHGISAASGKVGALLAGVIFAEMTADNMFIASGVCGAIGLVLTLLFVPDTTKLDLKELDDWWEAIHENAESTYRGPAKHRKYLSWFENKYYHYDSTQVVESQAIELVEQTRKESAM
eukprot:gb/GECG01001730.1/.p1 GENE.gb/GECG01001730.1/~~gb/GECG01001730.1/.p1  ORF type:complete len:599 (+),score=85.86 gb/GECG01001730.1/:1-1797(+)